MYVRVFVFFFLILGIVGGVLLLVSGIGGKLG